MAFKEANNKRGDVEAEIRYNEAKKNTKKQKQGLKLMQVQTGTRSWERRSTENF